MPAAIIKRKSQNLDAAAAYLSMSPWTIRDLEAKGVLPRVRVPLPRGGELRKLLFDKADLDRLIGTWKDTVAVMGHQSNGVADTQEGIADTTVRETSPWAEDHAPASPSPRCGRWQ